MEAMSLGTPVVSTNCMTGPAEILAKDYEKAMLCPDEQDGEYGILTAQLEPGENLDPDVITDGERRFAAALERMLTDEKLRSSYAVAAKLRAADFSEEAYRKKLLSFME